MMYITVQSTERVTEKMTSLHVNAAVAAIRADGYVVLENVVDPAHLDFLRERMDADSQQLIQAEKWGGAGRLKGHLQQGPPPFAPYIFADIVANPFVIQVTQALLGPGIYNSFYNGNTNCPGSVRQPLHRDGEHLWPGMSIAHPTASVVVNIAPVEVTEENGSVELWPGTHLDTRAVWPISPQQEAERRAVTPPVRGNTKKGSVLIRDTRLWHRGVPNHSDHPRHMIAMIYNVHWLGRKRRLKFKRGCEGTLVHSDLDSNADFIDEEPDYLFNPRF